MKRFYVKADDCYFRIKPECAVDVAQNGFFDDSQVAKKLKRAVSQSDAHVHTICIRYDADKTFEADLVKQAMT
jgi:hypothetical protein